MSADQHPGTLNGASMLPPLAAPRKEKVGRSQTRNRFAELNAFVDMTLAELTPGEVAVWLILWRDTKHSGTARTSQADLGRRAGMTVRGVQKAIRRLAGRGLLKVVSSGKLRGRASVYKVRPVAS